MSQYVVARTLAPTHTSEPTRTRAPGPTPHPRLLVRWEGGLLPSLRSDTLTRPPGEHTAEPAPWQSLHRPRLKHFPHPTVLSKHFITLSKGVLSSCFPKSTPRFMSCRLETMRIPQMSDCPFKMDPRYHGTLKLLSVANGHTKILTQGIVTLLLCFISTHLRSQQLS